MKQTKNKKRDLFYKALEVMRVGRAIEGVNNNLSPLMKHLSHSFDFYSKMSSVAIDTARRYQKYQDPAVDLPNWAQRVLSEKK
jgi:hypothetical protein